MLITEFDKDLQNTCSFCDEKPDAIWMGSIDIFCCRQCAINILPQLMADAVVGGTAEHLIKNLKGGTIQITHEERILKRYYSAFTSALIRKWKGGLSSKEVKDILSKEIQKEYDINDDSNI